jgi:mannose-6-phosphate isomerase-like protein (cupin superfamily)
MAKTGDEIFNPRTGQRMIFLETGKETDGDLLRNEFYNPPTGVAESEHVHPIQESGAEVISGSVRFRVGGEERSHKAGESITIPANTNVDLPSSRAYSPNLVEGIFSQARMETV